jgi:hypothetical protein
MAQNSVFWEESEEEVFENEVFESEKGLRIQRDSSMCE